MAFDGSSNKLVYHKLPSSEATPEALRHLLDFSTTVFEPYLPIEQRQHNEELSKWQDRINLPNAVLLYATTLLSDEPLGFCFAFPRIQPEIGEDLFHIWLAGVSPRCRGLGVFRCLMDNVKQEARQLGYHEMTVCTYPERFEDMYRILMKTGWKEVAWREDGQKILMKTSI